MRAAQSLHLGHSFLTNLGRKVRRSSRVFSYRSMAMNVLPGIENHTRVQILGAPVDCLSFEETLGVIRHMLKGDKPNLICTADASGLMIAQTDSAFMRLLQTANLVTADSVGVIWAAKRLGYVIPERVSGVELVDALCALSADEGFRIYFLGSEPGVAEMAAEKMRLRHPGCRIVGARHGYFPASDDEVVAHEIAPLKPDILFVAMGIPRQENFIEKTRSIINAKVAMGVGGSLDVFSGRVRRAPKPIQKLHLEWLWRTLANPKKISKAKHLPAFVLRVLKASK